MRVDQNTYANDSFYHGECNAYAYAVLLVICNAMASKLHIQNGLSRTFAFLS